jgi:hypothetical protein
MCSHGNLLRSSALAFNENCLQQELTRERTEKDNINIQNSTPTNKSTDADEKKDSVYTSLSLRKHDQYTRDVHRGISAIHSSLESCTGTSFCTRTRTSIAIPGPESDPNTSTRTQTEPDPTDIFKNMKNFSNFYFIKNIKNIQRNSTFSNTSMDDESLNHHQIHFDFIFSILIIVKN